MLGSRKLSRFQKCRNKALIIFSNHRLNYDLPLIFGNIFLTLYQHIQNQPGGIAI